MEREDEGYLQFKDLTREKTLESLHQVVVTCGETDSIAVYAKGQTENSSTLTTERDEGHDHLFLV